jgi:hypothetical protein
MPIKFDYPADAFLKLLDRDSFKSQNSKAKIQKVLAPV